MSIKKIISKEKYWLSLLGVTLLVVFSRYFLPARVRIEDYQELIFLLILFVFYYFQKYLDVGISKKICFSVLIFWVLLQGRVFLMRELGYYNGKVLISKLEGDSEGYRARAIALGIKVIGKTYHLSGPSLIPYELGEADIRRWFGIKKRPALIISGSINDPQVEIPLPELYSQIIQSQNGVENKNRNLLWLEGDALNIKIPAYQEPLSLPLPPARISLEGENSNVINHYIGWISGYFHPELSINRAVRQDTIHEASRIDSPWKNNEPRAIARYLKSMEEVFEIYPNFDTPQVLAINIRLAKVLVGLKNKELISSIQNLRALLFLVQGKEREAKRILKTIVLDKKLAERQRFLAAKNLAILELGL